MANEKRLIDANALRVEMQEYVFPITTNNLMGAADAYYRILHLLDDAPTVDAVEVVRCKDCKHWRPSGSMAGNSEDDLQPIGGCDWAICCRKANDFCSYGERREGE